MSSSSSAASSRQSGLRAPEVFAANPPKIEIEDPMSYAAMAVDILAGPDPDCESTYLDPRVYTLVSLRKQETIRVTQDAKELEAEVASLWKQPQKGKEMGRKKAEVKRPAQRPAKKSTRGQSATVSSKEPSRSCLKGAATGQAPKKGVSFGATRHVRIIKEFGLGYRQPSFTPKPKPKLQQKPKSTPAPPATRIPAPASTTRRYRPRASQKTR